MRRMGRKVHEIVGHSGYLEIPQKKHMKKVKENLQEVAAGL